MTAHEVGTNLDAIPREMKHERRWVLADCNKLPKQPNGDDAESDNPYTWSDFDTAAAALAAQPGRFAALGFVLGGGWAGVDVDGANMLEGVKVNGAPMGMTEMIEQQLETYAEVSMSGGGYHHIARVSEGFELGGKKQFFLRDDLGEFVKDARGHKVGYEVYDGSKGRYFVVTGNVLEGHESIRQNADDVLKGVHDSLKQWHAEQAERISAAKRARGESHAKVGSTFTNTDDELLRALDHIPCSQLDYDDWLQVGIELKAACYDVSTWDTWSATDPERYGSGVCARKWNTFNHAQPSKWIYKKAHECNPFYRSKQWEEERQRAKEQYEKTSDSQGEKSGGENSTKSGYRNELVNMGTYLKAGGAWDAERARRYNLGELSTGYEYLDSLLGGGLYPDLYVLGGAPGCGKTTLALSIADNIAASGWPVLYICTEQTQYELAAKSINRIAHSMDYDRDMSKLNSLSIIKGYWPEVARAAADEYVRRGTPTILSCEFDATIEGITADVDMYEKKLKASGETRPPFIVLDYLQLLRSETASNSEREITDAKLRALKAMQRENDEHGARIVMCISSFGRDFYKESGGRADTQLKPPTMGAWKESGNVEYTAAVCLALWRWAGNKDYEADEPGAVRCNCLKNRYGRTSNTFFYMDFQKDTAHNKKYQEMIDEGLINRPKTDD